MAQEIVLLCDLLYYIILKIIQKLKGPKMLFPKKIVLSIMLFLIMFTNVQVKPISNGNIFLGSIFVASLLVPKLIEKKIKAVEERINRTKWSAYKKGFLVGLIDGSGSAVLLCSGYLLLVHNELIPSFKRSI